MKIIKVKISEFKILKDIDQDISGASIMVIGENGVGKSSFIQFIEIALGKSNKIPPDATGKGYVLTNKDGKKYCFLVTIKDGKSKVTIETEDGLSDNRKSALATIVGAMDFDIDEFAELSKSVAGRKKQVEIFKSFLPEEFRQDLARFESNIKVAYDERTEIHRNKKNIEGAMRENSLNTLSEYDLKAITGEVSTEDLTKQLSAANEHNAKVVDVKNRCNQRFGDISVAEKELRDFQKEIDSLNQKMAVRKDSIIINSDKNIQAEVWLVANPEKPTSATNHLLSSAGAVNKQAVLAKELLKQRVLFEKLVEEEGEMTAKIEAERQAIADAVRDCDSPVAGLMFEGDDLKYNGILVSSDSLSTSEIMELGIKLKMAENPELGILFIQRGESLGKKRLAEIMALATKNNWQVIMEEVRRGTEKLKIELIAV